MVKQKKFVERTPYSKLKESSKSTLASTLEKVHKTGFSARELLEMNEKDFRSAYGTKAIDWKAQQRRLRQIVGTNERKNESAKRVIDTYKKQGFRSKRLEQIEVEVNKSASNTFQGVVDKVKDKFLITKDQEAYKYARDLLKVPPSQVSDLNATEQEILYGYDTSP